MGPAMKTKQELLNALRSGSLGFYFLQNNNRARNGYIKLKRGASRAVNAGWLASLPQPEFEHWEEGQLTLDGQWKGVVRRKSR